MKAYRHTGIVVNSIVKSKKFYCGLLKLKIMQEFIEHGNYFNQLIKSKNLEAKVLKAASEDNVYVELIEFSGEKKKKFKLIKSLIK
jgi:hypothetical protein